MKDKRLFLTSVVIFLALVLSACQHGRILTATPSPLPDDSHLDCFPHPQGLISQWSADGDANDQQGENEGKLSSGVTFTAGIIKDAFSFDGTDYVSAPTSGLPTGSSDRTLELWAKLTSFHKGETFFAGYGNFGSSSQSYHLGATSRTLFFSQWGQALFGPDLETGQWYHIAVTNVGNVVTLYLDGESVGRSELTIDTPGNTQLFIGGLPVDGSKRLEGLADEVAIYNRALTPEEIKSIFQAGQKERCR